MKLPQINYQTETMEALEMLREICPGTVALQAMEAGFRNGDPILLILDQCIRTVKAYKREFGQSIGDNYVARPEISSILSGARAMLNFDSPVKWEAQANSTTRSPHDFKDNGLLESLYWTACEIAGIDGNEI
jgi:hypothetical protein